MRRWPEPRSAAAGVASACAGGGWAVAASPRLAGALVPLAVVGALLVAGATVARHLPTAAGGLGLLGLAYLAGRAGRPVSVLPAAGFGCLLLLAAELVALSSELAVRSDWSGRALVERAGAIAAVVGGALPLAWLAGEAGLARLGSALPVVVAGGGGLLALVGLVARQARR